MHPSHTLCTFKLKSFRIPIEDSSLSDILVSWVSDTNSSRALRELLPTTGSEIEAKVSIIYDTSPPEGEACDTI